MFFAAVSTILPSLSPLVPKALPLLLRHFALLLWYVRLCVMTRSYGSPRARLHVVGMLWFMSDINHPSSPTPFYSVLLSISVFMALSTVFYSIYSPGNSPFSYSVLPVLSLPYGSFNYISIYESLLHS